MVFIDDNNLINKIEKKNYFTSIMGTKVCQQKRVIIH